jgi:FkbM family methyltransferase
MKARIVDVLLWFYQGVSKAGLLEHPLARRAFESAYLTYKLLIEAGPVARLQSVVPSGSTVVDVGANIGFFSLRFARWVGPWGRVIAIEPEGRNVAALRRRVARARMEPVVDCVQAAAADRPGEVRLALNPVHPGDHRIAATGEPIRAVTVDELTGGDIRRISLVKIDVQGAEMLVLSGAQDAITAHRPALFIEVDDTALRRFGSSAEELLTTVVNLGYTAHTLTRTGISASKPLHALVGRSGGKSYSDVLFLAKRPATVGATATSLNPE